MLGHLKLIREAYRDSYRSVAAAVRSSGEHDGSPPAELQQALGGRFQRPCFQRPCFHTKMNTRKWKRAADR